MKIRSILAGTAVACMAVGGGAATASAASATTHPVPMATGNVALAGPVAHPLSGPIQYMSFTAFAGHGRYHGTIDYANFNYPAFHTNVFNVMGTHQLVFTVGASTYAHTMTVSKITPLSTHSTQFTGSGFYNTDKSYTWTVTGTVDFNAISFKIVYTGGPDKGYSLSGNGVIARDGSVSGSAVDIHAVKLPFTMPRGSAFQVLRYTAPVTWAYVYGHRNAMFGFTTPRFMPYGLANKNIVCKVHDGGFGFMHDTFAFGAYRGWFFGPITQYLITSGNIFVR